jgi:anti-anti-sigma regulatory factor
MPTQITQTEFNGRTQLRVKGEMLRDDAILIERLTDGLRNGSRSPVIVDIADLDFLDSESAQILRRLESEKLIEIEGMAIFLQAAVNSAERNS